MTKLHVGCGPVIIPGWVNMDINAGPGAVRHDVRDGLPFPDGTVDAIYGVHFLEHLNAGESQRFLAEAYRVLKPSGAIRLLTPDLRMAIRAYAEGPGYWANVWPINPGIGTPGHELFNWVAYDGGHKQLFDDARIKSQLEKAGFGRVTVSEGLIEGGGHNELFAGVPGFRNHSLFAEAVKAGPPIVFGIKVATYWRPTGKTRELLTATVNSVMSQSYRDWRIFLIGDNYEPATEYAAIVEWVKQTVGLDRLVECNLNRALEREKYIGSALWCVGGVNAMNTAIDAMHEYHIRYLACLDDDDLWRPDHLELLADAIDAYPDAVFWYTKGTEGEEPMPPENVPLGYNNLPPKGERAYHSTLAWDLHRMPLRYRNLVLHGVERPADADMLDRISGFCQRNGLKTVHIPEVTVTHTV